jgi:PKD repeat protein
MPSAQPLGPYHGSFSPYGPPISPFTGHPPRSQLMKSPLAIVGLALSCALISPSFAQVKQNTAPAFKEISGEREFSGWMVARPVQPADLQEQGVSKEQSETLHALGHGMMGGYGIREFVAATDEYIFALPEGMTENTLAQQLMASGVFQYVEPDWILYPIGNSNDPYLGSQWQHNANRMQSADGWDLHTGNSSTVVAYCDTGVMTAHEDLQDNRFEGYNAVDQQWESAGGNIEAVHNHGTNVTGCGSANGNNGKGVAGVGWNLGHRMMRVSNSSSGSAYNSTLTHAARTAIEAGDKVASVSYSGPDSSSNLTAATYIKSLDGLLVWAAGNDSRNLTYGNRDNDDIIIAGATDDTDGLAYFSAYGQYVDVTAPGQSVLTTHNSSTTSYAYVSGTSFACPITAGLCGLIWSYDPSLTPNEVEGILKNGCDDLGAGGTDNSFGYGRVNLFGSLSLVNGGGGGNPPVADFSGNPLSGTAPLLVSFSDLSTNSPTSWAWNFGDGNTSTQQDPSHTYTAAGDYTVTLNVSNGDGADTAVKTNYISVSAAGTAPTAAFSGTPTSGTAPLDVSFSDASTDGPTSWSWNFGDGNTSTQQNPSHTYTTAGSYTVSLTVSNAYGNDTDEKVDYVTVTESGGYTGQGFILSRNADFSTNDRSFSIGETVYVLVWTDQLNTADMRRNWHQFKKGKTKLRSNLTNNGDNSFTTSFNSSSINKTGSWTWKASLQDRARVRYQPSASVTFN